MPSQRRERVARDIIRDDVRMDIDRGRRHYPAGIRAWLVAFQYAGYVLLATMSPSILRVDRISPDPEQHALLHPRRSINSIQLVAGVDRFDDVGVGQSR